MPRYFFNLYDDNLLIDEEGANLPDEAAARDMALRVARELACHEVLEGHLCLAHRVEVEDEERRSVLVLPFGAAVTVKG